MLKRIKDQVKPEAKDIKEGKRIMRELNLILELAEDKIKAIDILEQKAAVFQGKLDTYASRKKFRKDNVCFELYRSKFYRGLTVTDSIEHSIEKNEVRSFWETMWTPISTESKGLQPVSVRLYPRT